MDNIDYFINKILELSKVTKTSRPFLTKDNRLGKSYVAEVFKAVHIKTGRNKYIMRYNDNIIKKMSKSDIIHVVCHELGHIRTKAKNQYDSEYKAEKFALKTIKKYYPEYYNRAIDYIEHAQYFKYGSYSRAFTKLLKEIK